MTHDCKRNGTTDLFTALNIATGEVITECRRRHTAADVLAFFRQIDKSMARPAQTSPLAPLLHAHHLKLVEPCRTVVRRTHPASSPPRFVLQRRRTR